MQTLNIADTRIRQDAAGRYNLSDLYQAAGSQPRQRPSYWLTNSRTKKLIDTLKLEAGIPASNFPVNTVKGHGITATYVVKELVYDYAMWVSPAFQLKVIRAYDALVTGAYVKPLTQAEKFWFTRRPHWQAIRSAALGGLTYAQIAASVLRSVGSVSRCVRRMVQVGLIDPAQLYTGRYLPATAQRLISTRQICLDWGSPAVTV